MGRVAVPTFLLRKLYRRGSLREVGDGRFAFTLQNPLASATVTGPPKATVNGIVHKAKDIKVNGLDLESLTPEAPWRFEKGQHVDLVFAGHVLRGANRILVEVPTAEFGALEIFVEDRLAAYCDVPATDESE